MRPGCDWSRNGSILPRAGRRRATSLQLRLGNVGMQEVIYPENIFYEARSHDFSASRHMQHERVGAAKASAAADRCATSLLFWGAVFAAIDERGQCGGVGTGLERSGVFDGGLAVAAENRFGCGAAAYGWARIRLPAGL